MQSVLFLKFHPGRRNQIEMNFRREGEYEIQMVDRRNEMMTFENPGLQNAKCMTDC